MSVIKLLSSPAPNLIKITKPKLLPQSSKRPIKIEVFSSPSPSFPLLNSSRNYIPAIACINSSSTSGSGNVNDGPSNTRAVLVKLGEALSLGFPIWVVSAFLIALWKPTSFLWVGKDLQIVGLTLTMLGMGMTLTLNDLKSALLMPKELAAGFILQYTIMPLSGYFVSKLFNLPSYYAAGLILVGCCPGGTASNIVTYLAKGNVALSVVMTAASTFAAAVVLAPVVLGAALNQYFHNLVDIVSPVMPLIAVATVAILCGSGIAQNASAILKSGLQIVLAVFALHGSGFFFGYLFSRMLGIDVSSSRTISIEVGMQNAMLGLVLANQHFGNPLTALPCALSGICHSIYGSVLAGVWRNIPYTKDVDVLKTE